MSLQVIEAAFVTPFARADSSSQNAERDAQFEAVVSRPLGYFLKYACRYEIRKYIFKKRVGVNA